MQFFDRLTPILFPLGEIRLSPLLLVQKIPVFAMLYPHFYDKISCTIYWYSLCQ